MRQEIILFSKKKRATERKKHSRGLMTFSLSNFMWNNNFCGILNSLFGKYGISACSNLCLLYINMKYSWISIIFGLINFGWIGLKCCLFKVLKIDDTQLIWDSTSVNSFREKQIHVKTHKYINNKNNNQQFQFMKFHIIQFIAHCHILCICIVLKNQPIYTSNSIIIRMCLVILWPVLLLS